MKRFLKTVLASLTLSTLGMSQEAGSEDVASTKADFYLSPNGSDEWSGTLAEPNEEKTDGPFASLERARDAVRVLKESQKTDIVVQLREGEYLLEKTVVFGLEDSGAGEARVTYEAFPEEKPVLTSGQPIEGWRKVVTPPPGLSRKAEGKVWEADVSKQFYTLYDEEGMLPRARSQGFIPSEGSGRERLKFPEGAMKSWPNLKDVELVVRPHHAWIVNILPLVSVDEEKQEAFTAVEATYKMDRLHFLKTTPSAWVENVVDELDEPGEWALNTLTGKVYLWPRDEAAPTGIVAPGLMEYIRVEGEIDKEGPTDVPARNLSFRGLTFINGERYSMKADDAGLQHDWEFHDKGNALLRLRGAENCTVEKCHFAHSGSGAIRVDLYGQKNTLSGNLIEHIGGTGILLCGYGPGTKDVNHGNLVSNNHIHHTGQIYSHSPGIMLWQSGENRVANNLVHHTPYTALIISGVVTEFFTRNKGREVGRTFRNHEIAKLPKRYGLEEVRPYLHTHDNLIELNEIHHAMEKLGDGNGIYVRGSGAGNIIRRNYIHHLVAPMIMQAAIRTDGGQMDTLITENLIYKCTSQGILLKLNNRCENNIVADIIAPPRGYYLSLREGPMAGATIKRNILYSSGTEVTFMDELKPGRRKASEDRRGRVIARAEDADTDQNLYYCAADPKLSEEWLASQKALGADEHSLAMDPLFVDAANGDFRFSPDSPAHELGIVPIDLTQIGLLED